MSSYEFVENVDVLLPEIASGSVVSRAFLKNEHVNVTIFGFDAGEGLTEHTASLPAILHILEGEAELTLGTESMNASTGSWAYMPPNLSHGILAKTQVKMLLILLKS